MDSNTVIVTGLTKPQIPCMRSRILLLYSQSLFLLNEHVTQKKYIFDDETDD